MKIGDLAKATGTQAETIRYYEREGLLPEAARTDSNYRVYGQEHVKRLAFVRHCRSLDMTLDEIKTLLRFRDAPGESCGEVDDLLDEHIGHIEARIKELRSLQKELKALRARCGAPASAAACGILGGLDQAALEARAATAAPRQAHVAGAHRKVG